VNHPLTAGRFRHPYIAYHDAAKTTKVFLRDTTAVSGMALLLFGGPLSVEHEAGRVAVNGWLRVRAAAQVAVLVKRLRDAVDGLLLGAIAGGGSGSGGSGSGISGATGPNVLQAIRRLLAEAEDAADRA
jgi:ATP-dependent RNA helicase DHX29